MSWRLKKKRIGIMYEKRKRKKNIEIGILFRFINILNKRLSSIK